MSGYYILGLETDEVAEADAKVIDLSLERSERNCVVKGCHPLREIPLDFVNVDIFLNLQNRWRWADGSLCILGYNTTSK